MKKHMNHIEKFEQLTDEERLTYLLKESVTNNKLWILTDEHGCMMLNTEEEDCIPVWPTEALAQQWINDDWQHCKAEAISLNKWFSRWTQGLMDDDLAIVIFPSQTQQGLILSPDEFEFELKQQQRSPT